MKHLLLFPLVGTILFTSCSEKKEETQLPDPRDSRIEELEARLETMKKEAADEREKFSRQAEANEAVLNQLKDTVLAMREPKVEKPEDEKVTSKPAVRTVKQKEIEREAREKEIREGFLKERLLAKGEEHEFIMTETGEIYRDVVITEVSDIGISFRHRGGAGRIDFKDLPRKWRERFGYDPELFSLALKREAQIQNKQAMAAAKELEEQKERNEKLASQLAEAHQAVVAAWDSQPEVVTSSIIISDGGWGYYPPHPLYYEDHYYDYCPTPIVHYPRIKLPIIGGGGHHRPWDRPVTLPVTPGTLLPKPNPVRPGHDELVSRPTASRPTLSRPTLSRPTTSRPTVGRPTASSSRPSVSSPSSVSRPTVSRPSTSRPSASSRPSVSRPTPTSRPSVSRPSVSRPSPVSRPSVSRPSVSAPVSRPSAPVARPAVRTIR
ncbi:MAG: hypothetical protein ACON38_19520 [Akkermansiaceae bacterium]